MSLYLVFRNQTLPRGWHQ